jgi:hypothetical protein
VQAAARLDLAVQDVARPVTTRHDLQADVTGDHPGDPQGFPSGGGMNSSQGRFGHRRFSPSAEAAWRIIMSDIATGGNSAAARRSGTLIWRISGH